MEDDNEEEKGESGVVEKESGQAKRVRSPGK